MCIFAYIYIYMNDYHRIQPDYSSQFETGLSQFGTTGRIVYQHFRRSCFHGDMAWTCRGFAKSSDQPWFNPLTCGRGKTTGTSQCNSLGIKFHKLMHFPVYNPFFLRGKVTFFPIDLGKNKIWLQATRHQNKAILRNAFDWRCEGWFEHQPPVVSDVIWKNMWIFMVQNHRKCRVQQRTVGDLTIKRWLCQLFGAVSQC